jgi:hypothetical protein
MRERKPHMKLTTKDLMDALQVNDDDTTDKVGAMQLLDTDLLAATARGEVDLNVIASWLLATRGQDATGAWVGFPEAERLHRERQAGRLAWSETLQRTVTIPED